MLMLRGSVDTLAGGWIGHTPSSRNTVTLFHPDEIQGVSGGSGRISRVIQGSGIGWPMYALGRKASPTRRVRSEESEERQV